jgi:hypothetical protein
MSDQSKFQKLLENARFELVTTSSADGTGDLMARTVDGVLIFRRNHDGSGWREFDPEAAEVGDAVTKITDTALLRLLEAQWHTLKRAAQQEFQRDLVEFVRIGYNDCSIHFLAVFDSYGYGFKAALEAIKNVESYNNFSGAIVREAVRKILPYADKIIFGSEFSPVLYIELDKSISLAERSPEEFVKIRDGIIEIIKKAFAETKFHTFRIGQSFFGTISLRFSWS